jgi:glycerol-3-phosphate cytidylyltransferase
MRGEEERKTVAEDSSFPQNKKDFLNRNYEFFENGLSKDAVFVGSDWKGSVSWKKYEQDFKSVGVDVVYIPYTDGTSSTLLKQVLNEIIGKKEK